MAKMFYTLEESAAKLGKSTDEVQALITSGALDEFRDGDRTVLKAEQVDLLAGDDDDDDGIIPLAESGELEPLTSGASGSGSMFEADPGNTGISIFDPEGDDEAADPAAQTQVSAGADFAAFTSDPAASGSGLSNIALEADDTSLGADLLGDEYGDSGGQAGQSGSLGASAMGSVFGDMGAAESQAGFDPGADLFESSGAETESTAPVAVGTVMAEAYDGPGSGLVGGLALAMVVVLAIGIGAVVFALRSGDAMLGAINMTHIYAIAGGGAFLAIIAAGIGFMLFRKG